MSEQSTLSTPPQAGASGSDQKLRQRATSDPREVAALVMDRMNQVNIKKEELGVAIRGLIDVTQQLTRTYVTQTVVVEQLRRRVKALETPAAPEAARRPESMQ